MPNPNSITPGLIIKLALIFLAIKEQKISTNNESHKTKNYLKVSSRFKETTHFMVVKIKPLLPQKYGILILSIKQGEVHFNVNFNQYRNKKH